MPSFLIVFVNIVTFIVIVCVACFSIKSLFEPGKMGDKLVRSISFLTGVMAYVGSKMIGLSLPSVFFKAIDLKTIISWQTLVTYSFPVSAGVFAGWFILKTFDDDSKDEVQFRFIILLSALMLGVVADIYITLHAIEITDQNKAIYGPNLIFVLSLSLYIIIKYRDTKTVIVKEKKQKSNRGWEKIFER